MLIKQKNLAFPRSHSPMLGENLEIFKQFLKGGTKKVYIFKGA